MHGAGIIGTGYYVPEREVSNVDLERIMDTSDEWIRTRTGIQKRRYADFPTVTSDMCVLAARQALSKAGIAAEELDLIIVATVTPDMIFPATACLVQDRLGAKNAGAFDLEAGCSGFMYGMAIASQFIATGVYKYILVIGAEILSRLLNWEDRTTAVLFGDGAGAVIMGSVPEGYGMLSFRLGSDGGGGDLLKLVAGGSLMPPSKETVEKNLHTIQMRGQDVFKFAVREMPKAGLEALGKCGLTIKDVDYVIPHQANVRIIDAVLKRLEIPKEKAHVNLQKYGNISSASIPLAMHEALENGKIARENIILTLVFGAGLTWGASVLKWW